MSSALFPFSPWQPVLSLWIRLFWTFHKRGIICFVGSLWPASFTEHTSGFFRVVTCLSTSCWFYCPLYRYTISRLSVHQLRDSWVVSAFWLLWIMLLKTGIQVSIWDPAFNWQFFWDSSFVLCTKMEVELLDNLELLFVFLRKHHTVFHSGCTSFHFHQ